MRSLRDELKYCGPLYTLIRRSPVICLTPAQIFLDFISATKSLPEMPLIVQDLVK
jgi:hypothetical protein